MSFGLPLKDVSLIQDVLRSFSSVSEAIVYGSRAKGNHRPGSDIDLTLKGENLSLESLNRISAALDDLLLPYTFDISVYAWIENPALVEHIERVGKPIYRRT